MRRRSVAWVCAAVGIAVSIGLLGHPRMDVLARLDAAWMDVLVRATASSAPASRTVVVDIDEASLAALGQWPWPRYRVAALLERVAAAQPASIALDVLFPEPDRTSLASIREGFKRDFGLDIRIDGVPEGLLDNDGYLGAVMAATDAVGAGYASFDHASGGHAASSGGCTNQ